MSILDTLERKFARFAIPRLTLYLVFGQSLFLVFELARPGFLHKVEYLPNLVAAGQYWRLVTFLFYPPTLNPFWACFALYFFWLMGTALENHWGSFRYNLYLLIAYLATLAGGWLTPDQPGTSLYIQGSVFLAFAYLYPDFVILLFFILPIRIKWLALITWFGYLLILIQGTLSGHWETWVYVLASILNFLLFFGWAIGKRLRYGTRKAAWSVQRIVEKDKPFHVCAACGITDKTHPKMDFRYCPQCSGSVGYCTEHINSHEHKLPAPVEVNHG
jgi:hypothetical protein